MLQATAWQTQAALAQLMWMLGAGMQLTLSVLIAGQWLVRKPGPVESATPLWFLPAVGNIIVPIAGVPLGFSAVSTAFFVLGALFWLVLVLLIALRRFTAGPLPAPLFATWVIFLAPPSVGFLAWVNLQGSLDAVAQMIYLLALLVFLGLLTGLHRFIAQPFSLASWAYSFPLAAFANASLRMAAVSEVWLAFGVFLTIACSLVVLWLLVKTVQAYRLNKICIPQ